MTNPLIRPAVAMFLGVVLFNTIFCLPICTFRLGPSVKKTIFAGTCSVKPNRLAAYAPEG